jgi:uncharacterized membrane protein YccF (DUF307 family)
MSSDADEIDSQRALPMATVAHPTPSQPDLPLRLLYWLLAGWWLALLWSLIAWLASASIVATSAAIWMHNRIFSVLTLAPWTHQAGTRWLDPIADEPSGDQRPLALRILYLILVGWWLGALVTLLAWALSATLLGLPFGLLAYSYVPQATTLQRIE